MGPLVLLTDRLTVGPAPSAPLQPPPLPRVLPAYRCNEGSVIDILPSCCCYSPSSFLIRAFIYWCPQLTSLSILPEFRLHYMPDSFAAVFSEPLFKFSGPGTLRISAQAPHSHPPPSPRPLLHSPLLLWAGVGIFCDKWSSHLNGIQALFFVIAFHFCFIFFLMNCTKYIRTHQE